MGDGEIDCQHDCQQDDPAEDNGHEDQHTLLLVSNSLCNYDYGDTVLLCVTYTPRGYITIADHPRPYEKQCYHPFSLSN